MHALENEKKALTLSFSDQLSALNDQEGNSRRLREQLEEELGKSQACYKELQEAQTQILSASQLVTAERDSLRARAREFDAELTKAKKIGKENDGELVSLKKQHAVELAKLTHKIKMEVHFYLPRLV